MNPTGNTMLITGGTSGIGRRLAEEFHRAGNSVIVAGRRRALLDEVIAGSPGMAGYELDVEDAAAVEQFAREVVDRHPALNILINNAGIMRVEPLTGRRDLADAEATIVTNLLGSIRLTNALVDQLVAAPDAAIVNVTSGLAFVPLPRTPSYGATKAALHSYPVAARPAARPGRGDRAGAARRADRPETGPGRRPGLYAARTVHRRGHGAVPPAADARGNPRRAGPLPPRCRGPGPVRSGAGRAGGSPILPS